jgi:alanine racemase
MGPVAIIKLSALRHNLSVIRRLAPSSKIIAVIKADAYGHGFLPVAGALSDVDMLAVARVSEGRALREAGFNQPLLVLEGFSEAAEVSQAVEYELEVVIHQQYQVGLLQKNCPGGRLVMWLKVDTGMHRLGVSPEKAQIVYDQLKALPCCVDAPGLMTHFANADDISHPSTRAQIATFDRIAASLGARQSMANSAGILAWPESHRDWVRPGIMLYGASPMLGMTADKHQLQPVMTLKSSLMAINHLKKGDCIGYGSSWCCPEDMPVGVVAIGYGDGYPRHARSGTPVLVNGQRCQLVGRVSMDMITVDLRNVAAAVGDEVILWGEGLPAEEVAESAGTISYELFCGVTSRVSYEYMDVD